MESSDASSPMETTSLLQRMPSDTNRKMDLHILIVPSPLWRSDLRFTYDTICSESISAGFIRTYPDINLLSVRNEIALQLDTRNLPESYVFLRNIGNCLTLVSKKQEELLKVKIFLPPLSLCPEVYILDERAVRWAAEMHHDPTHLHPRLSMPSSHRHHHHHHHRHHHHNKRHSHYGRPPPVHHPSNYQQFGDPLNILHHPSDPSCTDAVCETATNQTYACKACDQDTQTVDLSKISGTQSPDSPTHASMDQVSQSTLDRLPSIMSGGDSFPQIAQPLVNIKEKIKPTIIQELPIEDLSVLVQPLSPKPIPSSPTRGDKDGSTLVKKVYTMKFSSKPIQLTSPTDVSLELKGMVYPKAAVRMTDAEKSPDSFVTTDSTHSKDSKRQLKPVKHKPVPHSDGRVWTEKATSSIGKRGSAVQKKELSSTKLQKESDVSLPKIEVDSTATKKTASKLTSGHHRLSRISDPLKVGTAVAISSTPKTVINWSLSGPDENITEVYEPIQQDSETIPSSLKHTPSNIPQQLSKKKVALKRQYGSKKVDLGPISKLKKVESGGSDYTTMVSPKPMKSILKGNVLPGRAKYAPTKTKLPSLKQSAAETKATKPAVLKKSGGTMELESEEKAQRKVKLPTDTTGSGRQNVQKKTVTSDPIDEFLKSDETSVGDHTVTEPHAPLKFKIKKKPVKSFSGASSGSSGTGAAFKSTDTEEKAIVKKDDSVGCQKLEPKKAKSRKPAKGIYGASVDAKDVDFPNFEAKKNNPKESVEAVLEIVDTNSDLSSPQDFGGYHGERTRQIGSVEPPPETVNADADISELREHRAQPVSHEDYHDSVGALEQAESTRLNGIVGRTVNKDQVERNPDFFTESGEPPKLSLKSTVEQTGSRDTSKRARLARQAAITSASDSLGSGSTASIKPDSKTDDSGLSNLEKEAENHIKEATIFTELELEGQDEAADIAEGEDDEPKTKIDGEEESKVCTSQSLSMGKSAMAHYHDGKRKRNSVSFDVPAGKSLLEAEDRSSFHLPPIKDEQVEREKAKISKLDYSEVYESMTHPYTSGYFQRHRLRNPARAALLPSDGFSPPFDRPRSKSIDLGLSDNPYIYKEEVKSRSVGESENDLDTSIFRLNLVSLKNRETGNKKIVAQLQELDAQQRYEIFKALQGRDERRSSTQLWVKTQLRKFQEKNGYTSSRQSNECAQGSTTLPPIPDDLRKRLESVLPPPPNYVSEHRRLVDSVLDTLKSSPGDTNPKGSRDHTHPRGSIDLTHLSNSIHHTPRNSIDYTHYTKSHTPRGSIDKQAGGHGKQRRGSVTCPRPNDSMVNLSQADGEDDKVTVGSTVYTKGSQRGSLSEVNELLSNVRRMKMECKVLTTTKTKLAATLKMANNAIDAHRERMDKLWKKRYLQERKKNSNLSELIRKAKNNQESLQILLEKKKGFVQQIRSTTMPELRTSAPLEPSERANMVKCCQRIFKNIQSNKMKVQDMKNKYTNEKKKLANIVTEIKVLRNSLLQKKISLTKSIVEPSARSSMDETVSFL